MSPFGAASSAPASLACLISGASRGFGRALALAVAHHAAASPTTNSLHLVLLASSPSAALSETGALARAAASAEETPLPITVETVAYPFTPDPTPRAAGRAALRAALADPAWTGAARHVLFNNAGILGRTDAPASGLEFEDFMSAFAVNAAGHGALATDFLSSTGNADDPRRWIVHTSSKAAVAPLPEWTPYSMSKAAAESLHCAIAEGVPGVRVLQYAPGPMKTDMADLATEGGVMYKVKKWVGVLESSWKLMGLLARDDFANGCHVDFFDEEYAREEAKVAAR